MVNLFLTPTKEIFYLQNLILPLKLKPRYKIGIPDNGPVIRRGTKFYTQKKFWIKFVQRRLDDVRTHFQENPDDEI